MLDILKKKKATIIRCFLMFPVFAFHLTRANELLFIVSVVLFAGACFNEGYVEGIDAGVKGAISRINSEINKFRKDNTDDKECR